MSVKCSWQESSDETEEEEAIIRSLLEYAASVWDLYTSAEIEKLEKVQRRAGRFISKDYKTRQPGGCVTKMLEEHNLPPL